MVSSKSYAALIASSLYASVAAHGGVVQIKGGAKGIATYGFGIKDPAYVTRATSSAGMNTLQFAGGCGGTQPEVNTPITPTEIPNNTTLRENAGLPSVSSDGTLDMTWFQAGPGTDGSGPGYCKIDITGTGSYWKDCTISKQFGDAGYNMTAPFQIKLPTNTVCTGGSGNTCLLKVFNINQFGTCFAIKSPALTTGNSAAIAAAAAVAYKAAAASPQSTVVANARTPGKISLLATAVASSQSPTQEASKAIDGHSGINAGWPVNGDQEWSTFGQGVGATIKLTWSSAQVVTAISLSDRPNGDDQVLAGTLTFSDGTVVQVGKLTNNGALTSIKLPSTSMKTTSVLFTVTKVSSSTKNVGLSEFQVVGYPASNSMRLARREAVMNRRF